MRKLQFCLAVFALLALSFSAFAQIQNGQFTGTVTDPTGLVIANAKVTVVNQGTNLTVSTTTNASGNYTVKELPVGTYKLTAEAAGFKTAVRHQRRSERRRHRARRFQDDRWARRRKWSK